MTRTTLWLGLGVIVGLSLYAWAAPRAQTPTPQLKPAKEREAYQEPAGPPAPPPQARPQQRPRAAHVLPQRPQGVWCWYEPNGAAITIACNNGFWQTILPDGTVLTGNGMADPNAGVAGSTIVINPATGGPYVGAGQTVTPPTQVIPTPGPGQAGGYGLPYTEE